MNDKAKQQINQLTNELVMQGMILEAIKFIFDGKKVSDFELSFPIVRKASDLYQKANA